MLEMQSIFQQSKLKVLYIDDNPLDLQIILNQLSDKFEVTFATNGREALFYGSQHPQPDIFLIDIHMPSMNGFQLCEKFSNTPDTAHIPIIFITGNAQLRTKTRGFNIGCVDYVVKPIDPRELSLRIRNHVKLARQANSIKTLASRDPKTNISNYYKYIESLTTEWEICKRYDYPIAVLICEIDKMADNTLSLSNEQKEKVVLAVINAIRDIGNRPGDSVSRIDSATFAIILCDSKINHAVNCAKELLARISSLQIKTRPKSLAIQVTASIGLSSFFPEGNSPMMSIHDNANKALKQAKLSGGNDWHMHTFSQILGA